MATKTVNLDWVRKTIGVVLIIQILPFFWGYASADHWGAKNADNLPFEWSVFWSSYWHIYQSLYGWMIGISIFIIILVFCFAPRSAFRSG